MPLFVILFCQHSKSLHPLATWVCMIIQLLHLQFFLLVCTTATAMSYAGHQVSYIITTQHCLLKTSVFFSHMPHTMCPLTCQGSSSSSCFTDKGRKPSCRVILQSKNIPNYTHHPSNVSDWNVCFFTHCINVCVKLESLWKPD